MFGMWYTSMIFQIWLAGTMTYLFNKYSNNLIVFLAITSYINNSTIFMTETLIFLLYQEMIDSLFIDFYQTFTCNTWYPSRDEQIALSWDHYPYHKIFHNALVSLSKIKINTLSWYRRMKKKNRENQEIYSKWLFKFLFLKFWKRIWLLQISCAKTTFRSNFNMYLMRPSKCCKSI